MPFLKIKVEDIIFDPKVQTYCVSPSFKCPNYGHSWTCPPEAPYMKDAVSKFQSFYLIYDEINLNEYIKKKKLENPNLREEKIRNQAYTDSAFKNNLENEIDKFLGNHHEDYEERLILWAGFCRTCYNNVDKGCTYDSGKPCRYPHKQKYAMEAVGVNVTDTVKNLSVNIEWPPVNFVYRFGLICFK